MEGSLKGLLSSWNLDDSNYWKLNSGKPDLVENNLQVIEVIKKHSETEMNISY